MINIFPTATWLATWLHCLWLSFVSVSKKISRDNMFFFLTIIELTIVHKSNNENNYRKKNMKVS